MDNYVKSEVDEEFVPEVIIDGATKEATVMQVKPGSKTKNLIQYAEKKLAADSIKQIIWEGRGDAVQKTITCAEIMKKKFGHSLHQITRVATMTIVETWNPRIDGLDAIRVKRHLPFIKILLSKEALDKDVNGYQAPEDSHGLFDREISDNRSKRNNRPQQQNRNKRRNDKTAVENGKGAAADETLLGDSIRRKDFERKKKDEKRRKRGAGGGQNPPKAVTDSKRNQDSVERETPSPKADVEATKDVESTALDVKPTPDSKQDLKPSSPQSMDSSSIESPNIKIEEAPSGEAMATDD